MATRNICFTEKEFYHIYNRGTDKRIIYADHADYLRFTELLYVTNSTKSVNIRDIRKENANVFNFDREKSVVSIGAYCLMPNHFHLLVTPVVENGVAVFMKKLCTSYSMYFNKRYERTGSLFEGNFKAKHADIDEYLKYLFAYIHLNPVKLLQSDWRERGFADKRAAYEYVSTFEHSSLPDYLGADRVQRSILAPEYFPGYFTDKNDWKEELFDWLAYSDVLLPQTKSP